ncbi:MAG: class I SAM-dependent methyltransferase [Chlamydiota bacterium]
MTDRVKDFWEAEATTFDAFYTGAKGPLARRLDRMLRWDMSARFDETMCECREIEGAEILDVGCGSGRYALSFARRGARVTGVDTAAQMIGIARRLAREGRLEDRCRFILSDFLSAPLDRTFEVTLAIGFFDYIADPRPYLEKMACAAGAGGKIVATFPRLWTWRAPIRKARLGLRKCPVYFYTRGRVEELLRQTGWEPRRVSRVGKLHFAVAVKV